MVYILKLLEEEGVNLRKCLLFLYFIALFFISSCAQTEAVALEPTKIAATITVVATVIENPTPKPIATQQIVRDINEVTQMEEVELVLLTTEIPTDTPLTDKGYFYKKFTETLGWEFFVTEPGYCTEEDHLAGLLPYEKESDRCFLIFLENERGEPRPFPDNPESFVFSVEIIYSVESFEALDSLLKEVENQEEMNLLRKTLAENSHYEMLHTTFTEVDESLWGSLGTLEQIVALRETLQYKDTAGATMFYYVYPLNALETKKVMENFYP